MPTMMESDVTLHTDDVAVVRFTGRLDFTSAPAASKTLFTAIAAGHLKLVVDLGEVDFVDSAGLGCLIGGMRAARQSGGDLRIATPTEQVTMLLSLTSLDQVFQIHPTVVEALNSYA
jgi:anti-sigma B factor antagonist